MKTNYRKKIVALLMVMALIIVSIPSSVFAAEKAGTENKEPIGYIYFSIEKATIGQGFLVEPQKVNFYEGEDLGQVIARFLEEKGIEADCGVQDYGQFYLATVNDVNGDLTANFPEYIKENLPGTATDTRDKSWLGEFDYTNTSGWVFKDNNVHSPVGASGVTPEQGDVERFAFTVLGLGSDCWNTGWGDPIVPVDTNRDSMLKAIADINSSENKDKLLSYSYVREAYDALYAMAKDYTVEQNTIDAQAETLNEAVKTAEQEMKFEEAAKVIEDKIAALGNITLENKDAVKEARDAFNALEDGAKDKVKNIAVLESAEKEIAALEQAKTEFEKTKAEATDKINAMNNLTDKQKEDYLAQVKAAGTKAEVEAVLETATKLDEANKPEANKDTANKPNPEKAEASKAPVTGDENGFMLYALMILVAGSVAGTLYKRKMNR